MLFRVEGLCSLILIWTCTSRYSEHISNSPHDALSERGLQILPFAGWWDSVILGPTAVLFCSQVSSETHQRGGFIAAAQATMTKGKGQQQLIGVCLPVVMSPQVSHQLISGIDVLECKLSQEFPAADQTVQKCCQFSWTNLLNCWQQPKKIAGGASYCPIPCSALSNVVKKSTFPAPTIVRRHKKRAISGPIYFGDISILSSHRSNRPVSHSVIIAPKMVLHRNSDRNPSPYVALKKSPLQGPLYYS